LRNVGVELLYRDGLLRVGGVDNGG